MPAAWAAEICNCEAAEDASTLSSAWTAQSSMARDQRRRSLTKQQHAASRDRHVDARHQLFAGLEIFGIAVRRLASAIGLMRLDCSSRRC